MSVDSISQIRKSEITGNDLVRRRTTIARRRSNGSCRRSNGSCRRSNGSCRRRSTIGRKEHGSRSLTFLLLLIERQARHIWGRHEEKRSRILLHAAGARSQGVTEKFESSLRFDVQRMRFYKIFSIPSK
jgi:hypothetical protein